MARHGLGPENNAWVRDMENRLAALERGGALAPKVNRIYSRVQLVDFEIPLGVIAPPFGEPATVDLGLVEPPPWTGGCVVFMGAPFEGSTDSCHARFHWSTGGFSSTLWELANSASTRVDGPLSFSADVYSNTIDPAPWEPERLRVSILWTGVQRD